MAVCKVCGKKANSEYCFLHKPKKLPRRKPARKTSGRKAPAKRVYKPKKKQDPIKKELWDWYSRYNRLLHSDDNGYCKCYTCEYTGFWKADGIECGHFQSRAHLATFIHPLNCRPQCRFCNRNKSGQQYLFGINLDLENGPGTAEAMYILSKQSLKYTKAEYLEMIDYYKSQVYKLLKQKGLQL
jgi:hypothetical protein